jgi:hypothetical protein
MPLVKIGWDVPHIALVGDLHVQDPQPRRQNDCCRDPQYMFLVTQHL